MARNGPLNDAGIDALMQATVKQCINDIRSHRIYPEVARKMLKEGIVGKYYDTDTIDYIIDSEVKRCEEEKERLKKLLQGSKDRQHR